MNRPSSTHLLNNLGINFSWAPSYSQNSCLSIHSSNHACCMAVMSILWEVLFRDSRKSLLIIDCPPPPKMCCSSPQWSHVQYLYTRLLSTLSTKYRQWVTAITWCYFIDLFVHSQTGIVNHMVIVYRYSSVRITAVARLGLQSSLSLSQERYESYGK